MPKPYPKEFRDDVVAVARQGGAPLKQMAKDFRISEGCLSNWLEAADVEDGHPPGVTVKEAAELREAQADPAVHAAGARRDSVDLVAGEPDHHALGRSRGGWSTKTHLASDQHRGVLSFRLTPGPAGDSPEMITIVDGIRVARPGPGRPRTRPERVLADKAYSSRANRAWLSSRGIRATIPTPADQAAHRARRGSRGGRPSAFDTDRYKDRHAIECGINILKHHAGSPPATRNSPSGSPPPCRSPSSTTGSDAFRNRP